MVVPPLLVAHAAGIDGVPVIEVSHRWYVAHTHARAEEAALGHLQRQGFETFLPQYEKRRRHARRIDRVRAPLFPRYIFVAMDVGMHRWRAICSTIGVMHLVCNGDAPAAVRPGIVEEIQARVGEDGLIAAESRIPFKKGDSIRVSSGALADQIGLFDCATDDERVILLLGILGRQVKVKLPLEAVAPVI